MSTNPAAMRFNSHGCDFNRQVSGEGGECGGDCAGDAHADRPAPTSSSAHEDQCSSRPHFAGRVARDVERSHEVLAEKIANLRQVHVGEAPVVRPAGCHHHVVDCREVTEEPIESNRIRGVKGCGTQGVNLTGGVPQAIGIPAREDHTGTFRTCMTGGFESDAGATADQNNGLPKERRLTVGGRGDRYGAHRSSDSTQYTSPLGRQQSPVRSKCRAAIGPSCISFRTVFRLDQ